jgi:uncharacterized membrane protein
VRNHTLYPKNSWINYKIVYIAPSGNSKNSNILIRNIIIYIGEIIKRVGILLITIGLFLLVFVKKLRLKVYKEFILSSIIFGIFVILSITVPYISIGYDIGRVYIQALVFLSIPAALSIYVLFKKINIIRIISTALFFALHFLIFTGALYFVFGISNSPIQFSNSGEEYDSLYIHSQEVISSEWLLKNNKDGIIYTDSYTTSIFKLQQKMPHILYYRLLIPSLIPTQSYVYLGYTNTVKNKAYTWLNSLSIGYNVPSDFLDNYKNLIYNNAGSKIYK